MCLQHVRRDLRQDWWLLGFLSLSLPSATLALFMDPCNPLKLYRFSLGLPPAMLSDCRPTNMPLPFPPPTNNSPVSFTRDRWSCFFVDCLFAYELQWFFTPLLLAWSPFGAPDLSTSAVSRGTALT